MELGARGTLGIPDMEEPLDALSIEEALDTPNIENSSAIPAIEQHFDIPVIDKSYIDIRVPPNQISAIRDL